MTNADALPLENRLLRRNASRAAIIEAGRKVATREGVAELSLSAVAAQAGFGPSTVFGHFRNKDELLLAIIADDLAALAVLMRSESKAAESFAPPEYLRVLPPQEQTHQSEAEAPNDGEQVQIEAAKDAIPLRVWKAQTMEFRGENLADMMHENGAQRPRVDAWLERRLRVFERALEELERRLKETETNATKSLSLSEHGMKTLFDRMEAFERQHGDSAQSLAQRLGETERRQRGTTAELRAAVNDTATRIEILESKLRSDQDRTFGKRAPELPESPANASGPKSDKAEPRDAADDQIYAAAAQRAATAAAALAEMQQEHEPESDAAVWRSFAARRVRVQRKYALMATCLTLIAFVVGAFAAFYLGQARGHGMAAAAQQASAAGRHFTASRSVGTARARSFAASDPRARLAAFAQAGNAKAQIILGLQYLHGDGVAPDRRLAAEWMRRAAGLRDPRAQYWLGTFYDRGDGVAGDSGQAVRWYEAAAGQGNRKAMHALGVAYAQGLGTQKDYSEAARWFSKAAELGLVNSQFNLGVLYERGLGVPQSLLDAYKWYAIAAAQGDAESRVRVEVLKTQLTPDDRAAAEGAAAAFRPRQAAAAANDVPTLADLSVAGR